MSNETDAGTEREHPGFELHRALEAKNISDSTLADQSGLSRPLISQITNGNRRITPSSATKICRVIGGNPVYWVDRQQKHDSWIRNEQMRVAMAQPQVASVSGS